MIRERTVTLDAGPVRFFEAGEGRTVVWIHAFPLHAEMWRPELERVPDGWRFVAPDLRGFGPAADGPADAMTMDGYAQDLLALMDRLGIERAGIGGLSMGGYVAFAMLRLAPERIERLVLADTRPQADTAEGRAGRQKMRALALERGPAAIADEMLPRLLGPATREGRPEVVSRVRQIVESNRPAAMAAALDAMMNRPDSTADLGRVAVPALVLVGEDDGVTPPAEAESMARQIRGASLRVLPRSGHLSNLEAPEEFSAAVAEFLG